MTLTTRPDRIHANCTQPPMTDEQMRAAWNAGDPLAQIAHAARRRNGLSRVEVREIVLGVTA